MAAIAPARLRGRQLSDSGPVGGDRSDLSDAPARPRDHRTTRAARTLGWLVSMVVTWPIAATLHALHLDLLMLTFVLLTLCAVLPAGRSLVDRLVFGTVVLTGLLLVFGWIASYWPWGLQPVPFGVGVQSLVLLGAAVTGCRPQLPLRLHASDAVLAATGLLTAALLWHPLRGQSTLGRLPMTATAEDRAAHFALFATIRRIGGYPFLHAAQARSTLQHPTELVYPAGSHYLYAVLDLFRLSGRSTPALAAFDRYAGYVLLAYVALSVITIWAVRWVAGTVRWWQGVLGCTTAAVLLLAGPLPQLLGAGFDSEIAGLCALAVTAALAVRPLTGRIVNAVVLGCLLIAQAYVYSPFLLIGLPAVIGALVVHRRVVRQQPWRVAGILLAGLSIALAPTVIAERSGFSAQSQALQAAGAQISLSLVMVLALSWLGIAPLLVRSARGDRTVIAAAVVSLLIVLVTSLFLIVDVAGHNGNGNYYYQKLLTAEYLAGLVLLGSFIAALATVPSPRRQRPYHAPRRSVLLLAAVIAAAALPAAGQSPAAPTLSNSAAASPAVAARLSAAAARAFSAWTVAPLALWYRGDPDTPASVAAPLAAISRAGLLSDGVPSLYFCFGLGYYNWRLDYYGAALGGRLGTAPLPNALLDIGLSASQSSGSRSGGAASAGIQPGGALSPAGLRSILHVLAESHRASPASATQPATRLVSGSGVAAGQLRRALAAHPELRAIVLYLPSLG